LDGKGIHRCPGNVVFDRERGLFDAVGVVNVNDDTVGIDPFFAQRVRSSLTFFFVTCTDEP
jgi:hypothetical protein